MKNPVLMLIVIIAVLVALAVGKDIIIKTAVERGVQAVTGLPLSIKGFNLGILSTRVNIKGLALYNPKGFQDKRMLNAPEIHVDYDLGAIISGMVHLEEVRINIEEFTVVKNEKGQLNLDSLKAVSEQKGAKRPAKQTRAPKIKIDSLQLRIKKVVFKDYSKGPAPLINEFNLNLNEKYSNIADLNALVNLIVFKALANTTISSLAGFNLGLLKGSIAEAVKSTQGVKDIFSALPFGAKKEQ